MEGQVETISAATEEEEENESNGETGNAVVTEQPAMPVTNNTTNTTANATSNNIATDNNNTMSAGRTPPRITVRAGRGSFGGRNLVFARNNDGTAWATPSSSSSSSSSATTPSPVGPIRMDSDGTLRLDLGGGNVIAINTPEQRQQAQQQIRQQMQQQWLQQQQQQQQQGGSNQVNQPPRVAITHHNRGLVGNRSSIPRSSASATPVQFTATNSNNRLNVHVVPIPPLVHQQIPVHPSNSSNSSTGLSPEEENRFKCEICFEYMKDPVGCGKCSSRFCFECLIRATTGVHNNNNDNNLGTDRSAKCPTCRVEFRINEIKRDESLKHQIHQAASIPCRYEGCNQQLKLPLVSEHEKSCPFVPIRCRYATFGCKWTGIRQDIASHEANDCALAKVSVLVDNLRRINYEHSHRLGHVERGVTGAAGLVQVHAHSLRRVMTKSSSSIIDLFQYCHICSCATPHYFFVKDAWSALHNTAEARASVFNFLTMLPTIIQWIAIGSAGYQHFLRLIGDHPIKNFDALLDDFLLSIALTFLGIVIIFAIYADGQSNIQWNKYRLTLIGDHPMIRDVMAIMLLVMHLSAFEYHGASLRSTILWFMIVISSTFFPCMILTISQAAIGGTAPPTTSVITSMAKLVGPLLFGLRYGLIAMLFGPVPLLDTTMLVHALQKPIAQRLSQDLVLDECFLDQVPDLLVSAMAGCRLALIAVQVQRDYPKLDTLGVQLMDTLLAMLFAVLLNFFFNKLYTIGIALGSKIAQQSQAQLFPDGVRKDYNCLGITAFVFWVTLLFGIATTS